MGKTPVIGIDYTAAIHQIAGIGRLVREQTRALAELAPPAEIRLFVADVEKDAELPDPPGDFTFHPSTLSERDHSRMWQRLRLPVPVERWTGKLDLYHATDFALPPTRRGTKTVVTVPDLAFERFPDETMPGMLNYLSSVVLRSVEQADHVIAISEATRSELLDLYDPPFEKVSVIPLGVDDRFNTTPARGEKQKMRDRYKLPNGPLILTVGTMQPRKNHLRLVQAMVRLEADATLVITGSEGWMYDEVKEAAETIAPGRVLFTGFVDDDDLPALYRIADLMIYPALYEGFGLPVLEAMACGTPVITSNVSSLPEVAGNAALLVSPTDVAQMAETITWVLGDDDLKEALREKGLEQAARFTWARAAESLWAIYEQVLDW